MIWTSVLVLATMAGVLLGLAVILGVVTFLDRAGSRSSGTVRVHVIADTTKFRAAMIRAAGKP